MEFNIADIMPDSERVFQSQGIYNRQQVSQQIQSLITKAQDLFIFHAQPVGIIKTVSQEKFKLIFLGKGENEEDTPLVHIFPRADSLALFALTMGSKVSDTIEILFKNNDFALGSLLDSVASLAADKAVELFETALLTGLLEKQILGPGAAVLSYSPGYCGWHISGQEKLFQYLQPEEIGIQLNSSFLMNPLKSVTGLLVAGKKEIHIFESTFSFCRDCKTFSCQERIRRLTDTKAAKRE